MSFTMPVTYDDGYLLIMSSKYKVIDKVTVSGPAVHWATLKDRDGFVMELYLDGKMVKQYHYPDLKLRAGDSVDFTITLAGI